MTARHNQLLWLQSQDQECEIKTRRWLDRGTRVDADDNDNDNDKYTYCT